MFLRGSQFTVLSCLSDLCHRLCPYSHNSVIAIVLVWGIQRRNVPVLPTCSIASFALPTSRATMPLPGSIGLQLVLRSINLVGARVLGVI